jgi:hypothetical protein
MVDASELFKQITARESQLENFKTVVIKPLQAQIDDLRSRLAAYMTEQNLNSVNTDFGRAHFSTALSAKVIDKDAWLDFVGENDQWDMLTKHVATQVIADWHDKQVAVYEREKAAGKDVKYPDYPDGLQVERVRRLNIALKKDVIE